MAAFPEAKAVPRSVHEIKDHAGPRRNLDFLRDQAFMNSVKHVDNFPLNSRMVPVHCVTMAGARTQGQFVGWRLLLRDPAPAAAREDFGAWIRSSSRLCVEGASSHVNFAQLQSRWRRRAALAP